MYEIKSPGDYMNDRIFFKKLKPWKIEFGPSQI